MRVSELVIECEWLSVTNWELVIDSAFSNNNAASATNLNNHDHLSYCVMSKFEKKNSYLYLFITTGLSEVEWLLRMTQAKPELWYCLGEGDKEKKITKQPNMNTTMSMSQNNATNSQY